MADDGDFSKLFGKCFSGPVKKRAMLWYFHCTKTKTWLSLKALLEEQGSEPSDGWDRLKA